jgi:hypothetical protein
MTKEEMAEARLMLALAADRVAPDTTGATAAAKSLLSELLQLQGLSGVALTVGKNAGEVDIGLGVIAVTLQTDANGRIHLNYPKNQTEPVAGLRFNPITKALEAEAVDTDVAPVPGHRLPRKSALSVVLKAALDRIVAIQSPPQPNFAPLTMGRP